MPSSSYPSPTRAAKKSSKGKQHEHDAAVAGKSAPTTGLSTEHSYPAESSREFTLNYGDKKLERRYHRQFPANRERERGREREQHGHFGPAGNQISAWEEEDATGYLDGSDCSSSHSMDRRQEAKRRGAARQGPLPQRLMDTEQRSQVNEIRRRNAKKKKNSEGRDSSSCVIL